MKNYEIISFDATNYERNFCVEEYCCLAENSVAPGKKELVDFNFNDIETQEAEKFTDFEKVRDEIEERTARLAKSGTGISPIPIIVKVFSPDVIDLTVVDLPGIVKVGIIRSDT
jgi:hypothetical protein